VRSSLQRHARAATDAETPELVGEPIRLRFQFPVTESLVTVFRPPFAGGTRRRGPRKVREARPAVATAGSKGSPLPAAEDTRRLPVNGRQAEGVDRFTFFIRSVPPLISSLATQATNNE